MVLLCKILESFSFVTAYSRSTAVDTEIAAIVFESLIGDACVSNDSRTYAHWTNAHITKKKSDKCSHDVILAREI